MEDLASELVALQQRLALAERLAALGAFAGRMAHELGTPLHSIAGHLDLMIADPRLPPEVKDRTRIIAGEVDRLCGLLRDHLKRLRSPVPAPVPTDLNALVARIAKLMRPLLDAESVRLELELAPEAGTPFRCDPRQIEQVLLNLVQNALDAMPSGGTIAVRTAAAEHGRAVSVCDTGRGIPRETMPRVFEPFFTTKQVGDGSGLGLSICREIAHNHGGSLVLASEPGTGTVATLTLSES